MNSTRLTVSSAFASAAASAATSAIASAFASAAASAAASAVASALASAFASAVASAAASAVASVLDTPLSPFDCAVCSPAARRCRCYPPTGTPSACRRRTSRSCPRRWPPQCRGWLLCSWRRTAPAMRSSRRGRTTPGAVLPIGSRLRIAPADRISPPDQISSPDRTSKSDRTSTSDWAPSEYRQLQQFPAFVILVDPTLLHRPILPAFLTGSQGLAREVGKFHRAGCARQHRGSCTANGGAAAAVVAGCRCWECINCWDGRIIRVSCSL